MKRNRQRAGLLAALLLGLGLLLAGCGGDTSVEQLAEKEGLGTGGGPPKSSNVVALSNGPDQAAVMGYLTPMGFDSLGYYDISTVTPTLAELAPYDLVYYMSNYAPVDPLLLGDTLADFMDGGGRVVMASYGHTTTWGVTGRFLSGAYGALTHGATNSNQPRVMGTVLQPGHPIMAGVTTVTSASQDDPDPQPGSQVLARWDNGKPMVAVSASGRAVGIPTYAVPAYSGGDFIVLIGNAINFLLNQ